jgi:hypothetical protein
LNLLITLCLINNIGNTRTPKKLSWEVAGQLWKSLALVPASPPLPELTTPMLFKTNKQTNKTKTQTLKTTQRIIN